MKRNTAILGALALAGAISAIPFAVAASNPLSFLTADEQKAFKANAGDFMTGARRGIYEARVLYKTGNQPYQVLPSDEAFQGLKSAFNCSGNQAQILMDEANADGLKTTMADHIDDAAKICGATYGALIFAAQ